MDGNRRYAKKNHLARSTGHLHGFDTLSKILGWCKALDVKEITIFAFSFENFKRSQEEVDDLMEISREKFDLMIKEIDKINEHGICVRFWGELELLPDDIQERFTFIMSATRDNKRAYLNVCFAYSSRCEIVGAMNKIKDEVVNTKLKISDINENLITDYLYSAGSQPPDLLIRTSGVVRLSDFLLWQSSFTINAFVDVLWPEFSFWDLIGCLLNYQRYEAQVNQARRTYLSKKILPEKSVTKKLPCQVNN
uniref:Alkyl transferase n=2 Tax=Tetranychus urticae TaxID=32264 RepID=T1KC21_TETUR